MDDSVKIKLSNVSPAQAVKGRRKAFLLLICDGAAPEAACRQIWPNVENIWEHVARVMNDLKFKAAYAYLISHRHSKEALLQKCAALASDQKSRPAEKLNALRLACQLGGHISLGPPAQPKVKPKLDGVNWQLVELARKADEGGHKTKAS